MKIVADRLLVVLGLSEGVQVHVLIDLVDPFKRVFLEFRETLFDDLDGHGFGLLDLVVDDRGQPVDPEDQLALEFTKKVRFVSCPSPGYISSW